MICGLGKKLLYPIRDSQAGFPHRSEVGVSHFWDNDEAFGDSKSIDRIDSEDEDDDEDEQVKAC